MSVFPPVEKIQYTEWENKHQNVNGYALYPATDDPPEVFQLGKEQNGGSILHYSTYDQRQEYVKSDENLRQPVHAGVKAWPRIE